MYDINMACAGYKHSMVLTKCGKVFTWGKGDRDTKYNLDDFYLP